MNTNPNRQEYNTPAIERVKLDNEISLVLVSNNPGDPVSELKSTKSGLQPEYFNQYPIRDSFS